jgi:hypothetical protein
MNEGSGTGARSGCVPLTNGSGSKRPQNTWSGGSGSEFGSGSAILQVTKNYRTSSPKKLSLSSQKYGVGFRDPENPYPKSRGQKSTGSWFPDPDPPH